MKRQTFISTMLLALPAFSFAGGSVFYSKRKSSEKVGKKPFIVKSDESRYSGKQTKPGNKTFLHCKVSSTDTNEELFIQTSTPNVFKYKGGPPPHIHGLEDEIVYVVSGEFIVSIDGVESMLRAGDTAFIPKGTLHTIINPIENNPGTLMTIFQPAPKKVEDFFSYISEHGEVSPDIVPEGW
ncbi:cupin domain-containing protein [Flavobacterium sp. Sd200]|uniref:cupin domain-containing protein n=1 Tax=Flavobacterium sp. Sd200 TaxID=2692211 RepID=UPI001372182A|nr:cupin domain-containing protein [Flavobacterium sp. Sd200]MXN92213.1 cupin domain-containing protein [Flavobacterium sp. Sd200]